MGCGGVPQGNYVDRMALVRRFVRGSMHEERICTYGLITEWELGVLKTGYQGLGAL